MQKRQPSNGPKIFFSLLICLFSLFPIVWGAVTSLKTADKVYHYPPTWIPDPLTLSNYLTIFRNSDMVHYFVNTVIIAVGSTLVSMVVSILAAYGFSRYKFPGNNTLMWSILFTRLLPRVTIIIPFYITLKNMGILNTYPGLILVYLMVGMAVSVWLLKGYFDNLPYEIEEAATIDGCNSFQLLTKIVLPISLPALATVCINNLILAWNEFLFALTMTQGKAIRPISVGLAFYIDESGIQWGPLMAASILMSIPAIILLSIGQRSMVKGLSDGAVKG